MKDVHVHFLHGTGDYTVGLFERFIATALEKGVEEIYLLEHTHQFFEFYKVYTPIREYNSFQHAWLAEKMNGSIDAYLKFIDSANVDDYPVKVRFGLEVCYIPETADILADVLGEYSFDFLTGSVHWIDGWGFDHSRQKEIWRAADVNQIYRRYYEIMCELCSSGMFGGLAHPDSIKCFGYLPSIDMGDIYNELADMLNRQNMYAENNGGLRLNYSSDLELGLNRALLGTFKSKGVRLFAASDAHKQYDVGANIFELQKMID